MFFKKTALAVVLMSCCSVGNVVFAEDNKRSEPKEFKGVVTFVVDGDRFILETEKETHLVRMKWVDAPDDGQPLADEATTFLNELILGREVVVLSDGDNNGCLFGELIADGVNYNHEVVRSGFAHTFDDSPAEYQNSTQTAKKEKKGVWAGENPVLPNSGWKSVAEYQNGCQLDADIVDYTTEDRLKSGRDEYRFLTVPFYLALSALFGLLIWVGLNRFDDPRIALNKKRLERNKADEKEDKKLRKNLKQKSKDLIGSDKKTDEDK